MNIPIPPQTGQTGGILKGDIRSAALLMRDIENSVHDAQEVIKQLFPHAGKAHVIGVTGFPGAGKSTLIDRLILSFRKKNQTVGVIAVDPSSPLTGGAVLGDRIRMQRHSSDRGVFIRSVAARGHPGGLSRVVWDFMTIMDAMGMNIILIETAGVGQVEIDIRRFVHTNIVVMTPEYGDGIQAMKAGLLEIAHILVFNKTDKYANDPMTGQMSRTADSYPDQTWKPPVIRTSALQNKGIDELLREIERHKLHPCCHASPQHSQKLSEERFYEIFRDRLFQSVKERLLNETCLQQILLQLEQRETDPYSASEKILEFVLNRLDF